MTEDEAGAIRTEEEEEKDVAEPISVAGTL